ncbi:MAG: hypothetical protein ABJ205_10015 [Erythrobacter sp.]|uniref:head-tail connector protein n=1 Tax=Erythrobacter sp. TaxID=1042 RepID=UPI0032641BD9
MERKIVEPADVSGSALAELKSWLGITRPNEDPLLTDLLRMALAMCESFTGQAPLSQRIEERLSTSAKQSTLCSRPVTAVSKVEIVSQTGERSELASSQFDAEITSQGELNFRLLDPQDAQAVLVTAQAGIANSWNEVPPPLKQGIIKLCAHHYRDRDRPGDTNKAASSPPTIVSALWSPWQERRLT